MSIMIRQLNKWFVLFIAFLLWTSCSDKNDYEIVNSENILPQSQGKYEYAEDTSGHQKVELTEIQEFLLQLFPEVSFDENNILKEREMVFIPNRLGFSNKEETYFTKDSVPFHFIAWTFADSLKTVNAFYNWLDCFGHNCSPVRIDEEINGSKEAFVIWVSNNKISYLASTKNINRNIWQDVFAYNQKKKWNYIIHQAVRGRINWVVSLTPKEET